MCKTEANVFGSFPLLNFDYFCLTLQGNKGFNDFRQNVKLAETTSRNFVQNVHDFPKFHISAKLEEEISFQTYLRNLSVAYRQRLDANSNPDITFCLYEHGSYPKTGPSKKNLVYYGCRKFKV
jgi:hypothetical protein